MAPQYKLTYFPISALAEPIRLLLSYGGIEFEDYRFDRKDWPQLKPGMPFGQVPVLEFDGKKAHQSVAIARYLAKKVKLTGENDLQDLDIDAIVDTINDFRARIVNYYYTEAGATRDQLKTQLFSEILPYYLGRFEEVAKQNNGHLAAGKLTWADFFFVGLLEYLNHTTGMNLTDGRPNLQKVESNVCSLPSIKAWLAKRPKSVFM